jgi:hypothetical protein
VVVLVVAVAKVPQVLQFLVVLARQAKEPMVVTAQGPLIMVRVAVVVLV